MKFYTLCVLENR